MRQQCRDACICERRARVDIKCKNWCTPSHTYGTLAEYTCPKAFLCIMVMHTPHVAAATLDTIQRFRFQITFTTSLYSPEFASSDYQVFPPLKDTLRGQRFENHDEVKGMVLLADSKMVQQHEIYF